MILAFNCDDLPDAIRDAIRRPPSPEADNLPPHLQIRLPSPRGGTRYRQLLLGRLPASLIDYDLHGRYGRRLRLSADGIDPG
jgi:hypothetical protein